MPISAFPPFPKGREYTPLEALASLQRDSLMEKRVSEAAYGKLWRWSRGKVRRFMEKVGVQIISRDPDTKCGLLKGKKAKNGHTIFIDFSYLQSDADRPDRSKNEKRTDEGKQSQLFTDENGQVEKDETNTTNKYSKEYLLIKEKATDPCPSPNVGQGPSANKEKIRALRLDLEKKYPSIPRSRKIISEHKEEEQRKKAREARKTGHTDEHEPVDQPEAKPRRRYVVSGDQWIPLAEG
jgi:hypothetical protein